MVTYKTDRTSQALAVKAVRKAGSWSSGIPGMSGKLTREEKIEALKKAIEARKAAA